MKIALINHSFPPDIGGGETYLYTLAKKLYEFGNQITIITGKIKNINENHKNFKIINLNSFKKFESGKCGLKIYIKELKDSLTSDQFDIVYCNNFSSAIGVSYFQDLLKGKIVFSFHSGPIKELNKIIGYFNDWELECSFAKNIINNLNYSLLIANSPKYYKWALQLGAKKEKIKLVNFSVDLDHFNLEKDDKWRQNRGISGNKIVVVSAFRLLEKKGIFDIIKSIPLIKNPIYFYIAAGLTNGSKSVKCNVEEMIKELGVINKITLAYDEHNYFNINSVYANADLFVLPSHYEGFGISILEAMASKIPVLCSNIDGINDLVKSGENGLLFCAKNPDSLAANIDKICVNKILRENLVKNAYQEIIEKYNLDVQGEIIFRLFEELCRR
jgi:glycosyltransferase involved in cell wall biosynthesis